MVTGGFSFQILGPIRVATDGFVNVPTGGPRQRAVLAMLLLSPDRVVSVDRLVDALWSGKPPSTGRTQVAIRIAGLRKSLRDAGLGGDIVRTVPPGYVFASAGHRIDFVEFQQKVERGQRLAAQGDTLGAVDLIGQALALWRGPALSGVTGDVIEAAAAQLEEQRLTAYEKFLELRLSLGQHRDLVAELVTLVNEQPLREHARALLMLAQYRSGRRAECLEVFREGRRLYIEELGLEPGATLQRLHAAILRGDAVLSLEDAPAATVAAPVVPAQLPRGTAVFVGRELEQAALDDLLQRRADRAALPVAVLSGQAGAGKTALAVHWARAHADEFPDGQLYADLRAYGAEDEDPEPVDAVLARFLRALGVPPGAIPGQLADRVSLYYSLVRGRQMLVLLDNVDNPTQVEPLLPGGSCVAVVTARRHHELGGAISVRLGRMDASEAVELLHATVGRARADADPGATARVAELCDGLPLAVHVVCNRLATREHWTMWRMMNRLDDPGRRLDELSDGNGGVRPALASTYRRLDPAAALMFRRLGLLGVPAFSVSLAAALLDTTAFDAETLTERLVDEQLLEPAGPDPDGGPQYRMPGLVRLYARELCATGEPASERQVASVRAHDEWVASGRTGCPTEEPCGSCFLIEAPDRAPGDGPRHGRSTPGFD